MHQLLSSNRLLVFAGLYAGSAALLRALGFTLSLWMASVLPVEDYGRWGLLYACQTGLVTFGLVGLIEAVVGLLKDHPGVSARAQLFAAAQRAFGGTLGVSLAVAALGGALFLLPRHASLPGFASVLASGALLAYASLKAQLARLDEDHALSLGYSFTLPLIGLAGSALAFAAWRSAEAFFIGCTLGLGAALALLHLPSRPAAAAAGPATPSRKVLRRIAPFIAVAFLGWMSGYGNNFVVGAWFDSGEVARLTFALAISSLMQLVATALNQTWSPRFFRLTHAEPFDSVERRNRRFYRAQSLTLGATAALCIALLPALLQAAGGNLAHYAAMRLELFFVVAAYVLLGPWWHCSNYFLAHDRGVALMRVTIATSAIGIAAWLALMVVWGPLGVYVGFFVQMAIRTIGIVVVARRSWPVRADWGGVALGMLLALAGFWLSGG